MAKRKKKSAEEPMKAPESLGDESPSAPVPKPAPRAKPRSASKPPSKPKAQSKPADAAKPAVPARPVKGAKSASSPRGSARANGTKKPAAKTPRTRRRSAGALDWERLERMMWRMLGRDVPDDGDPDSPRSRASELLHRALNESEPRRVATLAREALALWPDCADAYVLLAESTRAPNEAIQLYEAGVAAAERDLGPRALELGRGQFWDILPTRPYMRARFGLAQVLWVVGRREEAVAHYRALIQLNPGDNQGIRYRLALALVELGLETELESFLRVYEDDDSACWAYTSALLAYRREGESPRARALLQTARQVNRHVSDYLLGAESFPTEMSGGIRPGGRAEAADYAAGALNGWRMTPGALDWLRRSGRKARATRPRLPAAKGPTPASVKRLTRLPQYDEVWFAEARLLPIWINVPDDPYRPWVLLVGNETAQRVIGQEIYGDRPSAQVVWDKLAQFMSRSEDELPHRPSTIELGEGWDALIAPLAQVDIEARPLDDARTVDALVEELVEHVQGRPSPPSLLDMPAVKPVQVASFYRAAAAFYRASPWQYVSGSETLKIECSRFESGPWYAVVFGQMGMTLGLALYDDLANLVAIREGHGSDEENARATVALSLTYGTMTELPVEDLDAIETHGWEIAAPDAYPSPIRKERGLSMRPPLAWEIQVLEAALRAIPTFLIRHDRADPAPQEFEVETGLGPLAIVISWVPAEPA